MRCIEIRYGAEYHVIQDTINSNMRCIEMEVQGKVGAAVTDKQ